MKEIKFRAYRKYPNPEMIYFTLEDIIFLRKPVDIIQEFEGIRKTLMQDTGLKDVNGKELYEGDFIKAIDREFDCKDNKNKYFRIFEVTYLNGCFMFGNYNAHEFFNKYMYIEVIGNICEKPELLEGYK